MRRTRIPLTWCFHPLQFTTFIALLSPSYRPGLTCYIFFSPSQLGTGDLNYCQGLVLQQCEQKLGMYIYLLLGCIAEDWSVTSWQSRRWHSQAWTGTYFFNHLGLQPTHSPLGLKGPPGKKWGPCMDKAVRMRPSTIKPYSHSGMKHCLFSCSRILWRSKCFHNTLHFFSLSHMHYLRPPNKQWPAHSKEGKKKN